MTRPQLRVVGTPNETAVMAVIPRLVTHIESRVAKGDRRICANDPLILELEAAWTGTVTPLHRVDVDAVVADAVMPLLPDLIRKVQVHRVRWRRRDGRSWIALGAFAPVAAAYRNLAQP